MTGPCTLAWPCVGIHHGISNRGGSGMRGGGGERSDVAVAARHIVTGFGRSHGSGLDTTKAITLPILNQKLWL
jgi:hypothetical protein